MRPNQVKNQIKFPVIKHEKYAGFTPVSIHAFSLLADSDNRLEKQEWNDRKPKRSLTLDRIKEEKMIGLR